MEPRERLIVALDVPSIDAAQALVAVGSLIEKRGPLLGRTLGG